MKRRYASRGQPRWMLGVRPLRWLQLSALVLGPIVLLNFTVATLGRTRVFPLSPFFLKEKLIALGLYARHYPTCLWRGHPLAAPLIASAERTNRLPRGLLHALFEVESELEPHRISPTGAMGIAQLMPGTARELGADDPYDSVQGVDGGARYLARLLRNPRRPDLAIAAYNAGPGAVRGRVPVNGETEHHVAKVMRLYRQRRGSK